MGWATEYIRQLKEGKTVRFKPKGHSMSGLIESGELVCVEPIELKDIQVGDIVLCKVNGNEYLHLVSAIKPGQYQISNNKGKVNGWTRAVYGRYNKDLSDWNNS